MVQSRKEGGRGECVYMSCGFLQESFCGAVFWYQLLRKSPSIAGLFTTTPNVEILGIETDAQRFSRKWKISKPNSIAC